MKGRQKIEGTFLPLQGGHSFRLAPALALKLTYKVHCWYARGLHLRNIHVKVVYQSHQVTKAKNVLLYPIYPIRGRSAFDWKAIFLVYGPGTVRLYFVVVFDGDLVSVIVLVNENFTFR